MSKKHAKNEPATTEPTGSVESPATPDTARTSESPTDLRRWFDIRFDSPFHDPVSYRVFATSVEEAKSTISVTVVEVPADAKLKRQRFVRVTQDKNESNGWPGRCVTARVRADTKEEAERLAEKMAYDVFLFEPGSVASCVMQEK